MVFSILALLSGLIAALPMVLGMIQASQVRRAKGAKDDATQDANLLDSVLPPSSGV